MKKEELKPLCGDAIPFKYRLCKCIVCDGTGLIQNRLDSWIRDVLKLGVLIAESINKNRRTP